MRMRTKAMMLAAAASVSVVSFAAPASASEETVGSCLAETILEFETDSGITLHELEEAAAEGDEEAKKELETLEEEFEACNESPNPILPATNEIIWGGLSFLILLGMMWKFAFPAVKNGMEARTERIRSDLAAADQAKVDAQAVQTQYEAQLADAKTEAARIVDEARQSADQVRTDLIARAEAEAAELRERANGEIESMRVQAIADVQSEVSEIAIGAAERVVGGSLDRDAQSQLVEAYIQELTSK